MDDSEELVEITLNNEGVDYTVVVNLATANVLLNDPDEAAKFIQSIHYESNMSNCQTNTNIEQEPNTSTSSSVSTIWSNKRPKTTDHEATKKFLELRDKYSEKFNDKKTLKNQIWKKIAEEMVVCGYNVGGTPSEVVEKLRQKFANLQKQYFNYIKHVNTTGEKKRDPPPYFDEIHGILGLKDKSNPQNLQDSLSENEKENDTDSSVFEDKSEMPETTNKSKIKNRFLVSRNTKPQSTNSQLLDLIQKFHEEEHEDRKNHFKVLENLLEVQNHQRDRLLGQLENFFKTKKRKRQASTSDSD